MTVLNHATGRRKRRRQSGNALIEFALVLPLLFLLVVNVVNFGGMLHAWIVVSQAARNGAQYWMFGGAVYNGLTQPTKAQVQSLVQDAMQGLPNGTSATIAVCSKQNGVAAVCLPSGSTAPPDDPETSFAIGSVDVTYTYTPYVSAWDFSGLGVHLTLPPTTIHRRCVMRLGQ
jgi:Flp pilus assembly protein TadG